MSLEEFELFYKEKFRIIFGFCFKRVGSLEDTEDIVSSAFEAFYKILPSVDDSRATPLLFQICKNKINDYLRYKYKFSLKNSDLADLEEIISEGEIKDEVENINSNLDTCRTILQDIIQSLSSKEKSLFEQKYLSNLTIAQMAKENNITENNVKVQTNRLVNKLKKTWEKMN